MTRHLLPSRCNAAFALYSSCLAVAIVLIATPASALNVLMVGAGANPTNGSDASVYGYLQALGHNVTYLVDTAGAGSTGAGYDAVVISSTVNSGNMRTNFNLTDSSVGIVHWEVGLHSNATSGNFFMSDNNPETANEVTVAGAGPFDLQLTSAAHPIQGGLPNGRIRFLNSVGATTGAASSIFHSTGNAAGVQNLAEGTTNSTQKFIQYVDASGTLLGNGSPGSPATAPGRRVFFGLDNSNFDDLNASGLQLFANAVEWAAGVAVQSGPYATANRDTGVITLHNPSSASTLNLLGYSILSNSGSLDPALWRTVAQNYDASAPAPNRIDSDDQWTVLSKTGSRTDFSEYQFDLGGPGADNGAFLVAGSSVALTNTGGWIPSLQKFEDLVFQISVPGTSEDSMLSIPIVYTGTQSFPAVGDITGPLGIPDGEIDLLDWAAFKAGYGEDLTGVTVAEAYLLADFDGNSVHTLNDFLLFKAAYETANGLGSFAGLFSNPVPEPATAWSLVGIVAAASIGRFRRRLGSAAYGVMLTGLLLMGGAQAQADIIWGIHSNSGGTAPVGGTVPSVFFSFDTSNVAGTAVDHGNIQVNGVNVLADALAVSSLGKAVAFHTTYNMADGKGHSQLLVIEGATVDGVASSAVTALALGSVQTGYLASGAAYDHLDRLWVLDNVQGKLFHINDTDGSIIAEKAIQNASGNTRLYVPFNNGPVDIAFDSLGNGYLTQPDGGPTYDAMFSISIGTGTTATVTTINGDYTLPGLPAAAGRQWVGLAVDPGNANILYGLTMSGADQIAKFDLTTPTTAATNVFGGLQGITGSNGGRGDLASGSETIAALQSIVLTINTTNGQAILKGAGAFDLALNGISITSDFGSLNPTYSSLQSNPSYGNGNPSDGVGWEQLETNSNTIAEANLTGSSTFSLGTTVSLGSLFVPGQGVASQDLEFTVSLANNTVLTGTVVYEVGAGLPGDFNNDGTVNLADYTVWRDNLGGSEAALNGNGNNTGGSTGVVDAADYTLWKTHFGSSGSLSAVGNIGAGANPIPEPKTTLLLALAMVLPLAYRWQRGFAQLCTVRCLGSMAVLLALATPVQAVYTLDRSYSMGDTTGGIPAEGGDDGIVTNGEPVDSTAAAGIDVLDSVAAGGFADLGQAGAPVYYQITASDVSNGHPGPVGRFAISFDGTDDVIKTSTAFNALSTAMSQGMQAWVYPRASGLVTTNGQSILYDSANAGGPAISPDGKWTQRNSGVTDLAGTVAVVGDQWHHVAQHIYYSYGQSSIGPTSVPGTGASLTYTSVIYVDGIAVSANNDTNVTANGGFQVGAAASGANSTAFFNGIIDEVEVYRSAYGQYNLAQDNDFIAETLSGFDLGDINFDGDVNNTDANVFISNWQRAKIFKGAHNDVYAGDLETYGWGDLNFDGLINMRDAIAMNNALKGVGGLNFSLLMGSGVAVPEPSSMACSGLLAMAALAYRRFQP